MVPYEFSISSLFLSRGLPKQDEIESLVDIGITNMEVALSSWLPGSSGLRSGKFDPQSTSTLRSLVQWGSVRYSIWMKTAPKTA